MGSQTIYHKTREREFILNFPATENILSWPISVENDGEFYEVVLTNVSSYTIEGVSANITPTNPYAVSAGLSYSVAIQKVTNGQIASILLRSRRAIKKSTVINVPDYTLTGNGYLYVLLDNNTVLKRDPTLTITSNYAGSGVWTNSTLISTISLPTNGGLIKWYYIHHDNDDVICWGRLANLTVTSPAYVCRIKPDGSVWDFFNTTQNSYWTSSTSIFTTNNRQYPVAAGVDYINGYYCLSCNSTSGASTGLLFKKSDGTITSNFLVNNNTAYQIYFNPIRSVFPLFGDVLSPDNRYTNLLYTNNLSGISCFSINNNRTYKANANAYLNIVAYNQYGNVLATYNCAGSSETGNGVPGNVAINKRFDILLSMSGNQASFAVCDFKGTKQYSRRITTFTESGLGSRSIAVNERSSQFFTLLSHASHLNKILVIDPNDSNIEIGYIQEAANILSICTNNYY